MTEQLGAMLHRLREGKGYSQLQAAEKLCEASGVTTVTRHEVSRWERQERIPSLFWLRWFATVLEVPLAELEAAAARTRKGAAAPKTDVATTERPVRSRREHPVTAARAKKAAAPSPTPAGSPSLASDGGDDPLSRVTITFEHRTTSVRLSATYDDPGRAVSAIGAFRSMVGSHKSGRQRAEDEPAVQGGTNQVPERPAAAPPPQRAPAPAAPALTPNGAVRVPMGIRYTSGPGVRAGTNGPEPRQ